MGKVAEFFLSGLWFGTEVEVGEQHLGLVLLVGHGCGQRQVLLTVSCQLACVWWETWWGRPCCGGGLEAEVAVAGGGWRSMPTLNHKGVSWIPKNLLLMRPRTQVRCCMSLTGYPLKAGAGTAPRLGKPYAATAWVSLGSREEDVWLV